MFPVDSIRDIFKKNGRFIPPLATFLEQVKKQGIVLKDNREELKRFYYAQPEVQVFSKPPSSHLVLQRKEGYYPKIISFLPFERLYCDSGFITVFPTTRTSIKKKTNVAPVVVAPPPVVPDKDTVPLTDNKEKPSPIDYKGFKITTYDNRGTLTACFDYRSKISKLIKTKLPDAKLEVSLKKKSWDDAVHILKDIVDKYLAVKENGS